ncbi:helix-turn-helix domain-containing protein [Clostridium sp. DL1XJH146]
MEEEVYMKIKRIRKEKKMTLRDVSEKTGFSISFLSQMERGVSSITMVSLKKITSALNISIKSLFVEEDASQECYRRDNNAILQGLQQNYKYFKILNGRFNNRKLDSFFLTLEPKSTGFEAGSHDGEELFYVLKGCATFIVDNKEYVIKAGESIHYPSTKSHTVYNYEDEELELLCVVTPPLF